MITEFGKCEHKNTVRDSPRCPLVYGSAPTENCLDCGGYRLLDRWASHPNTKAWRSGPVPTREDE